MKTNPLLRLGQVVFAKGVASSGGILLQIVMLSVLLPSAVGEINTLIAIALGLSLLVRGGLDLIAIREVSAWFLSGQKKIIIPFVRWCAQKIIIRVSLVSFFVAASFWIKPFVSGWNEVAGIIFLALCFSLVLVSSSIIKGMQKIAIGSWFEQGQILFLAAVMVVAADGFMNVDKDVTLWALILSGLFVLMSIFVICTPMFFSKEECADFSGLKERGFFLLNGITYLAQWGVILVVRTFYDLEDTGFFSTALRIGMVLNFLMMISNQFLVPKMSHYYKNKKYAEIESMMKKASGLLFCASLFLIILSFGAYSVVDKNQVIIVNMTIIVMLGQLLNVSTGPTGYLLSMSGREALFVKATMVGTLVGILSMATIGWFGGKVIWMAIGYSVSPILTSVFCLFYVKQQFGFYSLPSYQWRS